MQKRLGFSAQDDAENLKVLAIHRACSTLGLNFLSCAPAGSGRNLGATVVKCESYEFIFKEFRSHGFATGLRFYRELNFLIWCEQHNIQDVPKLLAYSSSRRWIAMDKLQGGTIQTLSRQHIDEAANFFLSVAGVQGCGRSSFIPAREPIGGPKQLYFQLKKKIVRSSEALARSGFPKESLRPLQLLLSYTDEQMRSDSRDLAVFSAQLRQDWGVSRIMSPSDFGFHNCVQIDTEAGLKLGFFDFEYAGLDHPLKTILDFLLQPDTIVTRTLAEAFLDRVSERFALELDSISPGIWRYFIMKWIAIVVFARFGVSGLGVYGAEPAWGALERYWSEFGVRLE